MNHNERYRLNTFCIVDVIDDHSLLIKTPMRNFKINSDNIQLIKTILNRMKENFVLEELFEEFNYSNVRSIFKSLYDKNLIDKVSENINEKNDYLDLRFINFLRSLNRDNHINNKNMFNKKILIVGNKETIVLLENKLKEVGFKNIVTINLDNNQYKNLEKSNEFYRIEEYLIEDNIEFIILFSLIKNRDQIDYINQKTLEYKIPWISAYIKDCVSYIGPLIIPNETPCISCINERKKINTNFNNLKEFEIMEWMNVNNEDNLYPLFMYEIIGNILVMEINRFFINPQIANFIGKELLINMTNYETRCNRALFYYNCRICSEVS